MSHGTHTHWRMTINNYDETDIALVQQGYPDHIRQLVYTFEEGEEGTPHIQAFIKMKRDCRLSHMKKLFPRGNFGAMDTSEWKLNQQRYAQKLDETACSPAVITNWDPLHTIEGVVKEVMTRIYPDILYFDYSRKVLMDLREIVEKRMVREDYKYAKVFVSATYKSMWKDFGEQMWSCIYDKLEAERVEKLKISVPTHTHTHDDEKISVAEDITDDAEDTDEQEDSGSEEGEDDESDQESESGSSEGLNESWSSRSSSPLTI